ncbi:MAG: hypothetical protein KC736_01965, partial [Candidatus Moranbacteria bacterium]|nr:hypothetical protein [Candidatus Moranbacteria bacterium]
MWNPFSKKKTEDKKEEITKKTGVAPETMSMFENMDLSDEALEQALSQHQGKMSFLEKMALKKFKKMSPEQRKEVLGKMMSPEKMEENKD